MKVVLIHGKNTTPEQGWYPWLKKEVEKRGIEFIVPKLPHADDPRLDEWLSEIDKTEPNENTILIGHSRGGVAIMRWLERLPKDKKVKKIILLASNSGNSEKINKTNNNREFFSEEGYDFEEIKKRCDNFVVIHSKNDPIVKFEAGEENARGLSAKFKIYEDKWHFGKCLDEVPEVLEEIGD